MKRCLLDRRPAPADAKDETYVAAALGHQRAAFEKCIEELEKLPFESAPINPVEELNTISAMMEKD